MIVEVTDRVRKTYWEPSDIIQGKDGDSLVKTVGVKLSINHKNFDKL